MAKIIIGREYAAEFESVRALYEGGFLSEEVHIKKVRPNEIVTPTNTFEYRENESGVNGSGEGEERALNFGADGASWFAQLRGAKFDSGNADWKQLIMDVAADYHKNYSLIEFRQTKSRADIAGEKRIKEKFRTGFLDRAFANGGQFVISDMRKTEPENYYAVSMRLEINGGGESAPLLAKIYFREGDDGRLAPITSAEAARIDEFVTGAVPAESGKGDDGIIDVKLVGRVFTGLEKAIAGGKFSRFVSFNEKYKAEIGKMLAQLATSEIKELECTNVKVLGVSHVEWEKSVYDISLRGKRVMKLILGLNGFVTLTCANCAEQTVLIDGNVIKFIDGEVPENCNSVLDFSSDNLGLISEDIQLIREHGEIANHLFRVSCTENTRNPDCGRTVCRAQTVELSDGVRKCKGCRYPEVVYKDIFSEEIETGKYTRGLSFCYDKLALVDTPTVKCRCCGREFGVSAIPKNQLCGFCSGTDHSAEAKKLYRKYGGMLSLGVRLSHAFSKKYCKEDGSMILFELGTDRYVFDKLNLKKSGYIDKPRKVIKGGLL